MRFRILGTLEAWTGQDWSTIGAPKWRALLAALLLSPNQVVSSDRLIAELWGDHPPDRAANLVSGYVFRLRRLIDDPKGRILVTKAPGYEIRLTDADLDASLFEVLAIQGRNALARGDAIEAAARLTEALALWRGSPLADIPPSRLVFAETERLSESRLNALELRMAADLRRGATGTLPTDLRRLISDHPLREGLWVLLIQALDETGRRAEAILAYGHARAAIAEELGVEPGPELRGLYHQLLAADHDEHAPRRPEARVVAGAGSAMGAAPSGQGAEAARPGSVYPEIVALGGVRAAGQAAGQADPSAPAAGAAERRDTIAGRGPREDFPAGAPAQLPADIGDFTGRKEHLRRLRELLAPQDEGRASPGAVNIAGVVGTPGLGKTVLAVHAAHQLRHDFPDGQLYVSLLGASQQPAKPDEVLARLLRDLGLEPDRIPASLDERAALYRTRLTDRKVLIVLDDARDAAQVRPLLPGSASCAVIFTSRHWIADLAGGRLVDLDVLDDTEAQRMLTSIIGEDRVAAEPEPVREVLTACAGLPLAIRIAGARLAARRGWTVRTLARRLADQQRRLDELTAGELAVRACFEVSFTSLPLPSAPGSVDPARVFRLLGLWQGPSISLPAVMALLGQPEDPVADALEILVDTHLLESLGPERYRFHDLLRAYAAERALAAESGEDRCAAVTRLLHWYLRTADAAGGVINPNRERVGLDPGQPGPLPLRFDSADEALAWTADERVNLVAATRQAAAENLHDVAWKLPVAVMPSFDLHGYRAEWLAMHQVALDSARTTGDRAGEAWALHNIGIVLCQQHVPGGEKYLEEALAIRQELGDLRGEAQATNNLAYSLLFQGRYERALQPLRDTLVLQRRAGSRYGESTTLCSLGEAYLALGRFGEAIACEQDALTIVRDIEANRLEGYVLQHLGRAERSVGHLAEGSALLEQALTSHRRQSDKYGEAQDLQHLGEARVAAGRVTEARELLELAVELYAHLGDVTPATTVRSLLDDLATATVGD